MNNTYCNSLTEYSRYISREVSVGGIPLGSLNPVRVQSMTTTDTMDTKATVEQTIRMVDAGCEYVRITAPSIKEARNLLEIKKELKQRGYSVPLIADIHFTPNAAEYAARIVEKVRINPGNYVDKKKFQFVEYTDAEYNAELDKIRQRFIPLVKICKEYGTAMRIGTNHGSLSDRIMSRFGDNPEGMVESALEFVRICEEEGYYNLVLSMKASNPMVMIQAYRLLVNRMSMEKMNYPLHLGVTEAGDGEDGRIKSAMGIGALLEDGLGDTIRVSLTEPPECEIPVAISLINRYTKRGGHKPIPTLANNPLNPFQFTRRAAIELIGLGGSNVPRVFADFSDVTAAAPADLNSIGYFYDEKTDKWTIADQAADFIYLKRQPASFPFPTGLRRVYDYDHWATLQDYTQCYPLYTFRQYKQAADPASLFKFVGFTIDDLTNENLAVLKADPAVILVLTTNNEHAMAEIRRIFIELLVNSVNNPVVIKFTYNGLTADESALHAATDFGSLLADGFGDGVWISAADSGMKAADNNRIMFNILQAARARISKTEYIACPSCGRTLFDLVETTEKIRSRTAHLKGIKLAIMGCIVNGPGEMADADYGYVGSGPGKITLYRGKDVIKRNVDSENAVDLLIDIIRQDGNWIDPPTRE